MGVVFDGAGCRRIAGAVLPGSALRIPARSGPLLPDLRGAEGKARWGRGDRAHPDSRPHGSAHVASAARGSDPHQAAPFCRTHPSPHGRPNSDTKADSHLCANDATCGDRTDAAAHRRPNPAPNRPTFSVAETHACFNRAPGGGRTHRRADAAASDTRPLPDGDSASFHTTDPSGGADYATSDRNCHPSRTHGRADPDRSSGNSPGDSGPRRSGGCRHAAP